MISVIVPVYNVRRFLDRCVESVVEQSYENWELLLVDDGSTDGSSEICDSWQKKDSRIRVIHTQNAGVSHARNTGLDHAAGEYICFLDSDDYLQNETLQRLLTALEKADAQMSVCNFDYVFEDDDMQNRSGRLMTEDFQIHSSTVVSGRELLLRMHKGKWAFVVVNWNKLYRKDLFHNLRYTEGIRFEDEKIIHHLVYPCERIALIPYVGYHYFQRSGSFMHGDSNILDYIEAYLDRCSFLLEKDEKELMLLSEGRLLVAVKKAKENSDSMLLSKRKKEHFRLVLKAFQKHWISPITLCKRFVICML